MMVCNVDGLVTIICTIGQHKLHQYVELGCQAMHNCLLASSSYFNISNSSFFHM
jgi:hypothetical protein